MSLWLLTSSTQVHAESGTREIWDIVRWANPAVAALCYTMTGNKEGLWRLVTSTAASQVFIEWTKSAFGDHSLNDRPDGTSDGIISGHSAGAVSWFLSLSDCVDNIEWINPIVANTAKIISGVAAGITVYSRVEADRHTALQSIAGAGTAALFHYYVAPRVNEIIEDGIRNLLPWSNPDANLWFNNSDITGSYVWAKLNFSWSHDSQPIDLYYDLSQDLYSNSSWESIAQSDDPWKNLR